MIIRAAIGAGRAHLVVQLLVESLVLAIVGGAAGIALAVLVVHVLVRSYPARATPPGHAHARLARPDLLRRRLDRDRTPGGNLAGTARLPASTRQQH